MRVKIVVINGQNRKGSTWNIRKLLVDSIQGEKEVSEFFLPEDLNGFCKGCYQCIEDETKCPHYQKTNAIMQKVEEADLLVFTTPTYCMAPSAGMKSFLDLSFIYWMSHRPRKCMFQKRAVVISTAAGIGTKQAIAPVKRALFYWGVPVIKTYGINVQAMNWEGVAAKKKEKIRKDMQKLAAKLSTTKRPRVPFKTRFMFAMMANMQKSGMGSGPADKTYWEEQGWLAKMRPWK